jgi:hypothetical protein
MGGVPWFYFVEYQPDIELALQALRKREFAAGRYHPVVKFPEFPVTTSSPAPGANHGSIEEALGASREDGTRSVLDMKRVGKKPDYSVVTALPAQRLRDLYGTDRPSRAMVEENMDFFEDIERGHGIYIIVYQNDQPSELFFAGYSYD